MKASALAISPRSWKSFCLIACGVVIVLIFAILPFVAHLSRRLTNWFAGSLPHPSRLWEEVPWLY